MSAAQHSWVAFAAVALQAQGTTRIRNDHIRTMHACMHAASLALRHACALRHAPCFTCVGMTRNS